MKKFILYVVGFLWSLAGVFMLGINTVSADGFTDQQSAAEVDLVWSSSGQKADTLLGSLQKWLNWLLGILALITLFILVYGGIMMVTAAWDEDKYKKWFTILKQAAVGLIFIGMAWLFILLVFFVVGQMSAGVS